LALATLAAQPLLAQRTLTIERFDASIRVDADGSIQVTEEITARFSGSWNGIYRSIPFKYRTPQGLNWTLGLHFEGATDDAGRGLRVETSRERHYAKYKIWVPGAQDATRTVVLRYRATNGLRFFDEHDELYWNVTGDEWDVPIEAATAVVVLPDGVSGLRAVAFNGVYGSTAQDATVEIGPTTVRVAMPDRLEYREGLSVVVGWDKGLVAEPTTVDRVGGVLASNWPLVIPIPVFFAIFAIWRRRGKDPRRRPIAVRYEPPEQLTPAEVGTLIDNSADMRDVTATLIDLAVRGHLRIEERDDPKLFGLLTGREYVLHRLTQKKEWAALAPHERHLLRGVFSDSATVVELSDLKNEFYKELPDIQTGIFQRLLDRGFYRARPDKVRAAWTIGGVVFSAALGIGGSILAARFLMTPVPFLVAAAVTAVILVAFGSVMPARTVSGTRALEETLGFEEFLERVESEHLKRIVLDRPELFDQYLPYAMALGVENKWAKAFEGIYTEPPRWYAGSDASHFSVGQFSNSISQLSTTAASTLASSPRSSGGSGFGGGGSSGGGGGGGGGGGF
jgi:uncharacterized membrane protein YgcG